MSSAPALPAVIDDAQIDEAARRLDIAGRLEGPHDTLFMDVSLPTTPIEPDLAALANAAVGLHQEIQDDDALADIQETLEDALRAGDQHGIDEGCDIYRGLLASRLKALAKDDGGRDRIAALSLTGQKGWDR